MSWVDIDAERLQARARGGRCGHGFIAGLCTIQACAGSLPDRSGRLLCRQCGRPERMPRQAYCDDCARARRKVG